MKIDASGEIADLQSAIIEMSNSLSESKQELESKVVARTCELEAARDEAIKSNEEKRRLIQKVNTMLEDERKGIANEIHDQLNAMLIVVRLQAQRIIDTIEDNEPNAHEEIKTNAQSIEKFTADLYEIVRGIVKRLRPEIIDTLGLRDAVEEMVQQYDTLHSQCQFKFYADVDFPRLKGAVAITAYRLIQEALSNVVKHSNATIASVRLHHLNEKNYIRIEVHDNGKGFDLEKIEQGIGLIGMRERVFGASGKLGIHTAGSCGTEVIIDLPIVDN